MAAVDADRNLLFGILALQMDFVTRDELVAAMNAWALEKHRPIGDLLVERGALETGQRDALGVMLACHVAKHAGDPAASLASLSSAGGVASDLRRSIADPDVRQSLAFVPPSWAGDPYATHATFHPEPPPTHAEPSPAGSRAGMEGDPYATRDDPPPGPPPAGSRYRKVREHARGGLGIVFVARDAELNREVALKEIRDGHADHVHHRAKFLLEAEITGGLEHPGIVPVYGLGHHEDGRPFYAMRFIKGDSLKQAIAAFHQDESAKKDPGRRALALQKLLRRFLDVCNAVGYAHSRGVLHRDLKPDNVMVGRYGETLVVDWGLAKTVGRAGGDGPGPLPEATLVPSSASGSEETLPGSVIGTPAYMSPEQAEGRTDLLGPASDVYSLGATLYCLLTGRPPVAGEALPDILRDVREGRFPRPREASPWLGPALEAICLKAMALRPDGRYASPRALAEDLERWLADEPVSAHREGWPKRLLRLGRRHRTAVASVAAVLATAAVATALGLDAVRRQRTEAEAAGRMARVQRYNAQLAGVREGRAAPQPGWTWTGLDGVARAASLGSALDPAAARDDVALRSEAVACLAGPDLRPRSVVAQGFNAAALAFSPDGRLLALGEFKAQLYMNCRVRVVEVADGRVVHDLRIAADVLDRGEGATKGGSLLGVLLKGEPVQDGVRAVAFSPDGRRVIAGTRGGRVVAWELDRGPTGSPFEWRAHGREVTRLAFGPGGATLYSCAEDRTIKAWNAGAGWAEVASAPARDLALAAGPDGAVRVFAATEDGRVTRLDPARLRPVAAGAVDGGRPLACDPAGRFLIAERDGELRHVDLGSAKVARRLLDPMTGRAHDGPIGSLAISPDGTLVASSCDSHGRRDVRLWDLASGRLIAAVPAGGTDRVRLAFGPDGRTLAATDDKRTLLYEIRGDDVRTTVALHGEPVRALGVAADGRSLACVTRSELTLWSLPDGATTGRRDLPTGPDPDARPGVAIHPDGATVAFHGPSSAATVWEPPREGGSSLAVAPCTALAYSADGSTLWGVSAGNQVFTWHAGEAAPRPRYLNTLFGRLSGLADLDALAPGGRWVLAAGRDGVVRLLRAGDGQLERSWTGGDGPVLAVALSPDETLGVAGTQGGSLLLIDAATGASRSLPRAHRAAVTSAAFGGDGRVLATGSADGSVRLWHQSGGVLAEVLTLRDHNRPVESVALDRDARVLAVLVRGEHAVRLWRLDRMRGHLARLGLPWPGT